MHEDELGVVQVGAREIYDTLLAVREDVRSLAQTRESVDKQLTEHTDRITKLEGTLARIKYGLPASAVTALVSAAVTIFTK